MYYANTNQKKAGVALLISNKRDFTAEKITRDQEGYYITMKGSIHQDMRVLNVHAPSKSFYHMKQKPKRGVYIKQPYKN